MKYFSDADACIDAVIERVGKNLVVTTPLALGKPVQILNALYLAAKKDPNIEVTLLTALTLLKPKAKDEFSGRLLNPVFQRIYGDYEDLLYEIDRREQRLLKNIRVIEFYLTAGGYLQNSEAQRNFISANYTHAIRNCLAFAPNIIAPMIATKDNTTNYSLSCNTDLLHDLTQALPTALLVGEINYNLPYMFGPQAEIKEERFDYIVKNDSCRRKLFSIPKQPLSDQDFLIGLYVSSLVKDGGCLQIGIGGVGDALVYALILRHEHNKNYQEIRDELGLLKDDSFPFKVGLFASTEMLVDGYLELFHHQILKKIVTDADGAAVAHAGFFVGSNAFYQELRSLREDQIKLFSMRGIGEINQLYGDEENRRSIRQRACFVNTTMKVTILGDTSSDSLDDDRTVSGVGGQYNFVAMAHELSDSRSVIICRSTRYQGSKLTSNIVFSCSNATIPRHLRDIVVTEYGIADLRYKTDEEVIKAMLNVTDSRFQKELLTKAKATLKLAKDYQIPYPYRRNLPEAIHRIIDKHRDEGLFPVVPYGSEFTADELALLDLLKWLKKKTLFVKIRLVLTGLFITGKKTYQSLFARMSLEKPKTLKDILYRALLLSALRSKNYRKQKGWTMLSPCKREKNSDFWW